MFRCGCNDHLESRLSFVAEESVEGIFMIIAKTPGCIGSDVVQSGGWSEDISLHQTSRVGKGCSWN